MSALTHPVGPRPARVYWLRRLIVIIVVGAVIALVMTVANAVAGRGSAEAASNGADGGATSTQGDGAEGGAASDETAPTAATSDGPASCGPEGVTIALTADHRTYGSDAVPTFTMTITNTSDTSCRIDAGEAARELLITSGSDRIWSSTDCLAADTPERMLLMAAGARDETTVTWQRVRSAEGCTDGLPDPKPGTYKAVAGVAGVSSTAVVFELE